MHSLCRTACLVLMVTFLVSTLSAVDGQAASRKKCINRVCKTERKSCITTFEHEFARSPAACEGLERESRRWCKKFWKRRFRENRKECRSAFRNCKRCCKRDRLACGVSLGNDCPPNTAGGPNLAVFTVAAGGDLDVGWTGRGHNQGLVMGTQFVGCLQDCDTATNPICTGAARVRKRSINGTEFAPPLPMLVADVAICVTSELSEPAAIGSLDLQTGAVDMKLKLKSVVHMTGDQKNPCPICTGETVGAIGECKGLTNAEGRICITEGMTEKFGNTSSDCLPFLGDNVGELEIVLDPMTTGTVTRVAEIPCPGGLCLCPGVGTALNMNDCDEPDSCSEQVCTDNEGSHYVREEDPPGVDQQCCMRNAYHGGYVLPCYGAEISRTGRAIPLEPLWPHPAYPKAATGSTLAGVFCVPATHSGTVNQPTGLGGPGALVLPLEMYVDLSL